LKKTIPFILALLFILIPLAGCSGQISDIPTSNTTISSGDKTEIPLTTQNKNVFTINDLENYYFHIGMDSESAKEKLIQIGFDVSYWDSVIKSIKSNDNHSYAFFQSSGSSSHIKFYSDTLVIKELQIIDEILVGPRNIYIGMPLKDILMLFYYDNPIIDEYLSNSDLSILTKKDFDGLYDLHHQDLYHIESNLNDKYSYFGSLWSNNTNNVMLQYTFVNSETNDHSILSIKTDHGKVNQITVIYPNIIE